jgi:hypothetical protein
MPGHHTQCIYAFWSVESGLTWARQAVQAASAVRPHPSPVGRWAQGPAAICQRGSPHVSQCKLLKTPTLKLVRLAAKNTRQQSEPACSCKPSKAAALHASADCQQVLCSALCWALHVVAAWQAHVLVQHDMR